MKLGTRLSLKPPNDRGDFEPERTRSKNNIAENLFALGYETPNTYLKSKIAIPVPDHSDVRHV